MAQKKQRLLIIVGPTASGKSALAVKLAKRFDGEIISADSRQVYRTLTIGTGKISKREMRGVRHHLMDIVSTRQTFTAHDFVSLARKEIEDIEKRGKLAIVCGGTGFYIDALVGRIELPDVPVNDALRVQLEKKSAAQLYGLLKKRDPKRAKTIERDNKRRLIRALEIAHSSKDAPRFSKVRPCYDALWIGIKSSDAVLRTRISKRVREWLRRGLVAETKRLQKSGIPQKRFKEFGFEYNLVAQYLAGELSKAELIARIESGNWRYSRKQIGYWRRNKDIRWFQPDEEKLIEKEIRRWLK